MSKHRGKRGDFWSKVDQSGGENACWHWIGSLGDQGYGQVRVNKRLERAHRRAWELACGSIPDGLHVLHECDNPPCCNPRHLFLGTNIDNVADRVAKGRTAHGADHVWSKNRIRVKGEANGRAKLTAQEVLAIRTTWQNEQVTKRELSRRFNVTDVLIGKIVRGEVWQHVGGSDASV